MAKSVIRKGLAAVPSSGGDGEGSQFVSIKAGEKKDIVPLTNIAEMIAIDQHVFWGDNGPEGTVMFPCLQDSSCPGCKLENKPRYRGMLSVLVKDDEGKNVEKVFAFGKMVVRSLTELAEAMSDGKNDIKGKVIRVSRVGEGMQTKYILVATGANVAKIKAPTLQVEEAVGELDPNKQIQMLREKGFWKKELDATAEEEEEVEDDGFDEFEDFGEEEDSEETPF